MSRIPPADLDRLKRDIPLRPLVEAAGVELHGQGDNLLGLCPFHNDTSASLVVSPSKNVWNCLGACQKGGSVIDWVMEAKGVSFRHAVELLRESPEGIAALGGSTTRELSWTMDASTTDC